MRRRARARREAPLGRRLDLARTQAARASLGSWGMTTMLRSWGQGRPILRARPWDNDGAMGARPQRGRATHRIMSEPGGGAAGRTLRITGARQRSCGADTREDMSPAETRRGDRVEEGRRPESRRWAHTRRIDSQAHHSSRLAPYRFGRPFHHGRPRQGLGTAWLGGQPRPLSHESKLLGRRERHILILLRALTTAFWEPF